MDACNHFVNESTLILDCAILAGPSLPGSAHLDARLPLLEAATAARHFVMEELTPDDGSTALLLYDEKQRAQEVGKWLLSEELCQRVHCVARRELAEQYPVIIAQTYSDVPVIPNEIIKGQLYLGSAATSNAAALDALDITHVVSVVERKLAPPAGRAHLLLQIPDADDAEMLPVLRAALPFVGRAVRDGGKVLVHCERGASRSVTVVCAFLMLSGADTAGRPLPMHRYVTLVEALDHVKAQRPCAQPNHGFLQQLSAIDVPEWAAWLQVAVCPEEGEVRAAS